MQETLRLFKYFYLQCVFTCCLLLTYSQSAVYVAGEGLYWRSSKRRSVNVDPHAASRHQLLAALLADRQDAWMHSFSMCEYSSGRLASPSFQGDGARAEEWTSVVTLMSPWNGSAVALQCVRLPLLYAAQSKERWSLESAAGDDMATWVRDGGIISVDSRRHGGGADVPLPFFQRGAPAAFERRWPRVMALDAYAWRTIFSEYADVFSEHLVLVLPEWNFKSVAKISAMCSLAARLDLFASGDFSMKHTSLPVQGPVGASKLGAFGKLWECYSAITEIVPLKPSYCNNNFSSQDINTVLLPPMKLLHGFSPSLNSGLPYNNIFQQILVAPTHVLPNHTLPFQVFAAGSSASLFFASSSPAMQISSKRTPPRSAQTNSPPNSKTAETRPNDFKWISLDHSDLVLLEGEGRGAAARRFSRLELQLIRHSRSSVYLTREKILWDRLLRDYSVVALLIPPPEVTCPRWIASAGRVVLESQAPSLRQWSEGLYTYVQALREIVPFFVLIEADDTTNTSVRAHCRPPSWISKQEREEHGDSNTMIDLGPPIALREYHTLALKTRSRMPLSTFAESNWTVSIISRIAGDGDSRRVRAVKQDIRIPGIGAAASNPKIMAPVLTTLLDVVQDTLSIASWPVQEVHGGDFDSVVRNTFYPVVTPGTYKKSAVTNTSVQEIMVVTSDHGDQDGEEDCLLRLRAHALLGAGNDPKERSRRYLYVAHEQAQFRSELSYAADHRQRGSPITANGTAWCSPASRPTALPSYCAVYCVTRQEELIKLESPANTEQLDRLAEKQHQSGRYALVVPSADSIHDALEEVERALSTRSSGDVLSGRHRERSGIWWTLWIPQGKAAPVVVYEHTPGGVPSGFVGPHSSALHFVLLYDSSCGLSSNFLKGFNVLERCYAPITAPVSFSKIDVTAVQRSTSWTLALEQMQERSAELMDLLFPYFLPDLPRLLPPQLILFNTTHAVTTLPTSAYIQDDNWIASIVQLFRLVDVGSGSGGQNKTYAEEEIWRCVGDLVSAEDRRRFSFREALWKHLKGKNNNISQVQDNGESHS